MNRFRHVFLIVIAGLLVVNNGCKKNPIDRLTNPVPDGSVPQSSGTFMLFDDELKTGGGLIFIPGGENQSIDLADHSSPRRSIHQLRYAWNGRDVFNGETGLVQHLFTGFQFIISPDEAGLPSTPARNVSTAGYTKLIFQIRGNLSLNTALRIEGPDDGSGGITPAQTELTSLPSGWTAMSLAIPAGHFSGVKTFITVTFQYTQPPDTTNPGEGGAVYFDDIRYEK